MVSGLIWAAKCLPLILDDLAQAVEHARVELFAGGAGAGLKLAVWVSG